MTPKRKAKELFNEFYIILFCSESDKGEEVVVSILAQKCALKSVDEIIRNKPSYPNNYTSTIGYWLDVKTEIEKL